MNTQDPTTIEAFNLNWERIGDQLCGALEAGCEATFGVNKKASQAPSDLSTTPESFRDFWHIAYALGEDGHLTVFDRYDEDRPEYKVTRASLLEGLKILQLKHPKSFARILMEQDDFLDSNCLLQCATFGEAVYS